MGQFQLREICRGKHHPSLKIWILFKEKKKPDFQGGQSYQEKYDRARTAFGNSNNNCPAKKTWKDAPTSKPKYPQAEDRNSVKLKQPEAAAAAQSKQLKKGVILSLFR